MVDRSLAVQHQSKKASLIAGLEPSISKAQHASLAFPYYSLSTPTQGHMRPKTKKGQNEQQDWQGQKEESRLDRRLIPTDTLCSLVERRAPTFSQVQGRIFPLHQVTRNSSAHPHLIGWLLLLLI